MRYLYFSDIDMTNADGPSVNEQVFCQTLLNAFPDTRFILPHENAALPFLTTANTAFYPAQQKKILSPTFWLSAAKTAKTIAAEVEKHDCDLVISRMTSLPFSLMMALQCYKLPIALKSQGRFWFDKTNRNWKDRLYLSIDECLSSFCLKHARAIDTVTPQAQATIRAISPQTPIAVIENSTNVDDFSAKKGNRKYKSHDLSSYDCVIGYTGTFPSQRGLQQLIAFAKNNRDKNFAYLVAGHDDLVGRLKTGIEQENLQDRFFFTGHIPYTDIPAVLSCIDIGVSFDDPERAKIIGNSSQKVRQYLSAGCPCISIDLGNEFLVDEDLGSLVSPQDDTAIEQAVNKWYGRLQKEGDALRARLRRYAVDHLSAAAALKQRTEFWSSL